MIVKNAYPILEYSSQQQAVINPQKDMEAFPRRCMVTFFQEVLEGIVERHAVVRIGAYRSEMKQFPVYRILYENTEMCIVQAVVASGSIAMMTDWLYGQGVEAIVCCGGCGVLEPIPAGNVLLPVRALRDEGASYKYLPPSRFVDLELAPVQACKTVLERHQVPYLECTTWSTDGFYRETREMVAYRRAEGCLAVEMECATMAAIAQFRQKSFGQLLYSGDLLAGERPYDNRDWYNNLSAREKLVFLSLEALCLL